MQNFSFAGCRSKNRWVLQEALVILVLTALVSCATSSSVNYTGLGNAYDAVPLTSRAITGKLSNGLKYYILENKMPENRAHLALVVNAGSVLEKEDERGYAHFLEHLAFNDTERFPKLELIEYLRSLGMRFGADANAYTSYDETVYHFDVPVETKGGIKQIPDRALAILDDWSYAVSLKPEDVESEKLVILEEMRTRLGAMERARSIMLPVLFAGSAYEDRQPIGLQETIDNASSGKIRSFYNRWYTSDNMALIFVGDFDGKDLEAQLEDHFNMPSTAQSVKRPRYELPPPKKGSFKAQIITDTELTSSSYMIYYKQKQSSVRGTIAYYRESVIDYLIDAMLTLRFEERASDPASAATEYWGGVWRWSSNSKFYSMGTSPKTGGAQEALKELLLEKESMRRFGFTQEELDRAKLNLVSYMEKQLSEKDRRDSRTYISGFTSHFLTGEDMADIEWEVQAVNSLLPGIGLKEILSTVQNYFAAGECIVFLLAPEAEALNLPSEARIKAIFKESENIKLTQKKAAEVKGELLDRIPNPGIIVSQEKDAQTYADILILSNGTKVILKETENRNNEIIMYAMAKGGTVNAPLQQIVSVSLLSEMIASSGLGPYSRTELINNLAGKQASISFWTSSYYRGFQGACTKSDLKTLFEMLHLFFTMPRLDEKAVSAMLDQYRTVLMHQDEDPQAVFSRELSKTINNNNPLFKPLEYEDIDKVSLEDALLFLGRCINPQDYTFVFTGNIDQKIMREYLETYIASIPSSQSMNEWIDPKITRPIDIEKSMYKGKDDKCFVYLSWFAKGPDDFSEKQNQIASVLSEYLDIALTDEIREKMGGVYSISAGASVSVIPKGEYSLSVYFQCNPERAGELIAAVKDQITDIGKNNLNQDTFNKAKEALLMQHESSMQRNLHIAQSYANSSALYDTPLSRLNSRPDVIRSVTSQEVKSLCEAVLAFGPVQVVMFPEKSN